MLVVVDALQRAALQEQRAQLLRHAKGDLLVVDEVVEVVHVLAEGEGVDVEAGQDAAGAADDIRPEGGAYQHEHHAQ